MRTEPLCQLISDTGTNATVNINSPAAARHQSVKQPAYCLLLTLPRTALEPSPDILRLARPVRLRAQRIHGRCCRMRRGEGLTEEQGNKHSAPHIPSPRPTDRPVTFVNWSGGEVSSRLMLKTQSRDRPLWPGLQQLWNPYWVGAPKIVLAPREASILERKSRTAV